MLGKERSEPQRGLPVKEGRGHGKDPAARLLRGPSSRCEQGIPGAMPGADEPYSRVAPEVRGDALERSRSELLVGVEDVDRPASRDLDAPIPVADQTERPLVADPAEGARIRRLDGADDGGDVGRRGIVDHDDFEVNPTGVLEKDGLQRSAQIGESVVDGDGHGEVEGVHRPSASERFTGEWRPTRTNDAVPHHVVHKHRLCNSDAIGRGE